MQTILKIVVDGIDHGLDDDAILEEVQRQRPLGSTGLNYMQRIRRIKGRMAE